MIRGEWPNRCVRGGGVASGREMPFFVRGAGSNPRSALGLNLGFFVSDVVNFILSKPSKRKLKAHFALGVNVPLQGLFNQVLKIKPLKMALMFQLGYELKKGKR